MRAKIRQFKMELRNTQKGEKPMNEYLMRIKAIVDSIISIGDRITQAEHIEAIFDGLSEDYDPFIISINTRLEPYTVSEVESLLIAQEVRLEKHNKVSGTVDKILVNLTTSDSKEKSTNNSSKSNKSNTQGNF